MSAIICELALVPYTACLGIKKFYRENLQREQIIDIIWILNICITFCTATVRDGQLEKEFKTIAKRYLTGLFVLDILSTLPAIILYLAEDKEDFWDSTLLDYMYLSYLLKLLRLCQVGNLNKIMLEMVNLLEVKLNVAK